MFEYAALVESPRALPISLILVFQQPFKAYYRRRVLKIPAVTPDLQLLFDPALNPDKDLIAIFGLRGRISF